ncbi:hypothetical protein [Streptomyces sp. NPDC046976]|uniref:hypothetical protein n=1 Tax=Streptomyces sp. NPDC046976 TaxID=3155258 RepID=UPI0033E0ED61
MENGQAAVVAGAQNVVAREGPQKLRHLRLGVRLFGKSEEVLADGGSVPETAGSVSPAGQRVDVDGVVAVSWLVLVVVLAGAYGVLIASDGTALVVGAVRGVRGDGVAVVVPGHAVAAQRVLVPLLVLRLDLVLVLGGRRSVRAGDHRDPLGARGVPAAGELVRGGLVLDEDAVVGECAQDTGKLAAPQAYGSAGFDKPSLTVPGVQGGVPPAAGGLDLKASWGLQLSAHSSGAIQHGANHAHRG